MPNERNHHRQAVLTSLLALLLLVWAYFHFSIKQESVAGNSQLLPGLQIVRADTGSIKTVPEGFPADIPLGDDITQSYRVAYTDKNVTQYTIGFKTQKSPEQMFKIYNDFLTGQFSDVAADPNYLVGTRGNQTLSIGLDLGPGHLTIVVVNLLVHS